MGRRRATPLPTIARLREAFRYDPASGLLTWAKPSTARTSPGDEAGSLRADGYRRVTLDGSTVCVHRAAWAWMTGSWPDLTVDHRDRVRDNNRWANLREASQAENCRNGPVRCTNRVGLKGVGRKGNQWRARITVNGTTIILGSFPTPEAAHTAYAAAADERHGEFGRAA